MDKESNITALSLNQYIDHTILRPDTSLQEIKQLCAEAIEWGFVAVCVPPYFVREARSALKGHKIKVATVVGFPFGYNVTPIKVEETRKAIEDGAKEIDLVMNIAAFKDGKISYVKNDMESVITFAHMHDKLVKVIIEAGLLSEDEIVAVCELCAASGADFVKTSTGFSTFGASVENVKLMRNSLPKKIKIKASGGIKTREQVLELIEAGADRIGTSSGINIMKS